MIPSHDEAWPSDNWRITMARLVDVAQRAGVSVAAASSVLGAAPSTIGVSARTRERILRAAADLKYRRNPLAASFRTGRTYDIGVCITDARTYLTHMEGSHRFWAICSAAARMGYRVSLVGIEAGQHMDSRLMDGCIVMGNLDASLIKAMTELAAAVPVLTVNIPIPGAIVVDEDMSWADERVSAARYLFGLGHRTIAVSYLRRSGPTRDVSRLFREVARDMRLDATIHGLGELTLTRDYASLDALWSARPFPTALYAVDDEYARAALSRLAQRGLRVPDDVSVFSGNTRPEKSPLTPALTGLDIHSDEVADEMMRKFVGAIESKTRPERITLGAPRVELIERESCAPPLNDRREV